MCEAEGLWEDMLKLWNANCLFVLSQRRWKVLNIVCHWRCLMSLDVLIHDEFFYTVKSLF